MALVLDRRLHDRTSETLPVSRRERRRRRRELARRDVRSARLAELATIKEILGRAVELVDHGWLQHAWFSYRNVEGDARVSHVADRRRAAGATVLSTCLVAAIRDAAPGGGQALGRTLEVTWHALHMGSSAPVQWCPAPEIRAAHVRDLTSWNDRTGRSSADVTGLLRAAIRTADAERGRVLAASAP